MSHDKDSAAFTCTIYQGRPDDCRTYPWKDAQVLFEQCIFVRDGKTISPEEAASLLGGVDKSTTACQTCGRCCFGWQRVDTDLVPVGRCCHLTVTGETPHDPLRRAMIEVSRLFDACRNDDHINQSQK